VASSRPAFVLRRLAPGRNKELLDTYKENAINRMVALRATCPQGMGAPLIALRSDCERLFASTQAAINFRSWKWPAYPEFLSGPAPRKDLKKLRFAR